MPATLPNLIREVSTLPAEDLREVLDFVLFLKSRKSSVVDASDEWTDDDLRDLAAASLNHAESSILGGDDAQGR